jgi:predicted AlkP superfamily pyrophosphatase or phosphodiesterase
MKYTIKNLLFLILICVVVACQPAALAPTAILPPAFTPTLTVTPSPTTTLTPTITPTPDLRTQIKRVLIITIDGLRPDAIALAPMPALMALMEQGAYSLTAQTIRPSATLPSHASMLTGLCPKKHGVNWNDYLPENGFANGTDLFDLAKEVGLETDMYAGKEKLSQVSESIDHFTYINDRDSVITDTILANFPGNFGVMLIHFPTVDWMGHEHGWLSPEQLSVARRADESIARLLAELDKRGLRDETLIIITADHGGHDETHGSTLPEDMTIPWIIAGPGVTAGPLDTEVHTTDTAATAAWALGLPQPPDWDGLPVMEAFGLAGKVHPEVVCP